MVAGDVTRPHFIRQPYGLQAGYPIPLDQYIPDPRQTIGYLELSKRSGILNIDGQDYQCNKEDIKDEVEIGRGCIGRVVKACMVTLNKPMAIKIRRLTSDPEDNKRTLTDLRVISQSRGCPYIVTSYGYFLHDSELRIVMELMVKSLDQILEKVADFPPIIIARIAEWVLRGLLYLQTIKRITYRDLKPSNILVNRRCEIKLADFGVAGDIENSQSMHSDRRGCLLYLAPERIRSGLIQNSYSVKADVWSMGITICELATGSHPYEGCDEYQIHDRISRQPPPRLPCDFPPNIRDFVAKCLQSEPQDRLSFQQLLMEPFVRNRDKRQSRAEFAAWLKSALRLCDRRR